MEFFKADEGDKLLANIFRTLFISSWMDRLTQIWRIYYSEQVSQIKKSIQGSFSTLILFLFSIMNRDRYYDVEYIHIVHNHKNILMLNTK